MNRSALPFITRMTGVATTGQSRRLQSMLDELKTALRKRYSELNTYQATPIGSPMGSERRLFTKMVATPSDAPCLSGKLAAPLPTFPVGPDKRPNRRD
jgi:hypothetical protein